MQIILLTILYANGQGVPQDYKEAVRWYRLAAEQGHAGAQVNLGGMYKTGKGVTKDYVHAYTWYSIAAANGSDYADRNNTATPRWYTNNRDRLAREMTPDQMAEAQRFAREWMATH